MSTEIVKAGNGKGVTARVAERFHMDVAAFQQTILATVFPSGKATKEQFAAFMVVADQYELNPLTKELYAFPAKGGGIVPVVSIDGWAKIINDHKAFDGVEFFDVDAPDGRPLAVTCRIHRKDRSHPTKVTEYLSECQRSTDPWKTHPRRMLRHKALIQCARVAFSFSGIYDEDEAQRILDAQAREVTVQAAVKDLGDLTARLESGGEKVIDARMVEAEVQSEPAPAEVQPLATDDGSPEGAFADWKA